MSYSDDYYDFFCGNDFRLIKIAVKNDNFHAIKIHGSLATTVDFSGGTCRISEILLTKCFKMMRIVWPKITSHIKLLRIYSADTLTHLDLSPLTNLEELSIHRCPQLVEITGLSTQLKILNVHGAKITQMDMSHCKDLEIFNVITTSSTFHANLIDLNLLKIVSLQTAKSKTEEPAQTSCQLSRCRNVHLMQLISPHAAVNLDISFCHNLTDLVVFCGHDSAISGLSSCSKIDFFYCKESSDLHTDEWSKKIINKIEEKNKNNSIVSLEKKLFDINHQLSQFKEIIAELQPSRDDMETIVQQNGAHNQPHEVPMVTINLLSAAKADNVFSFKNDLYRLIKSISQPLYKVLSYPQYPIIYMEKLPNFKQIEQQHAFVFHFQRNKKIVESWLKNHDRTKPNLLIVNAVDMTEPNLRQLIKKIFLEKEKTEAQLKNKKYFLMNNQKIIIVGDPNHLACSFIKLLMKHHQKTVFINDEEFHALQNVYKKKFQKMLVIQQHSDYNTIMSSYRFISKTYGIPSKIRKMKYLTKKFIKAVEELNAITKTKQLGENYFSFRVNSDKFNLEKKISLLQKTGVFHAGKTKKIKDAVAPISQYKAMSNLIAIKPVVTKMQSFVTTIDNFLTGKTHPIANVVLQKQRSNPLKIAPTLTNDAPFAVSTMPVTIAIEQREESKQLVLPSPMQERPSLYNEPTHHAELQSIFIDQSPDNSGILIDPMLINEPRSSFSLLPILVTYQSKALPLSSAQPIRHEVASSSSTALLPFSFNHHYQLTAAKKAKVLPSSLMANNILSAIETLEIGLNNLLTVLRDPEQMNEIEKIMISHEPVTADSELLEILHKLTALLPISIEDIKTNNFSEQLGKLAEKLLVIANRTTRGNVVIAVESVISAIRKLIIVIKNSEDKFLNSAITTDPILLQEENSHNASLLNLSYHEENKINQFLRTARTLTQELHALNEAVKSAIPDSSHGQGVKAQATEHIIADTENKIQLISVNNRQKSAEENQEKIKMMLRTARELVGAFKLLHNSCLPQTATHIDQPVAHQAKPQETNKESNEKTLTGPNHF